MPLSQSTVYRHFRIDTDTDISGDVVKFGTDKVTWPVDGVFVPANSLPARVAAVNAANPPQTGLSGYWFRIEVGPGQAIQPVIGINAIYAQVSSTPQTPILSWLYRVDN